MWALDGLAWVFDWAAGRFWEAADFCRDFDFWGLLLGRHPLEGLEPHIRGLAHFCWTARDRVRDFNGWIDWQLWYWGWQLQILGARLEYWIGQIPARLQELWDLVWGYLRQRAEDAWSMATQLWGLVYSWVQPYLGLLWDNFWRLKTWLETTALPGLQASLLSFQERLGEVSASLTARLDELRQTVAALNTYRDAWNFILNSYQILTFTFVDSWDRLKAFLVDPPGSIWAWLEPILLDRVEQFLNERWDTRR